MIATPAPTPTEPRRGSRLLAAAPVVLTVVVLGVVAGDRALFRKAPGDAEPYHRELAAAAGKVPTQLGAWLGAEAELPRAAVQLLQPNLVVSRRYRNVHTGRSISFILIQCRDARDLIGHYPPVCYPGQGWVGGGSVGCEWDAAGTRIHGTRYEFGSAKLDQLSRIRVDNFMVLPDGTISPDMDGIHEAARHRQKRFYGAAQVQVVSDVDLPAAEYDEFFGDLLRAVGPLVEQIRSGVRS